MSNMNFGFHSGGNASTSAPDNTNNGGTEITPPSVVDTGITPPVSEDGQEIDKPVVTDPSNPTPPATDPTNPTGGTEENQNDELPAGTVIEANDQSYTVSPNGDLVDDKGVVFKEAKDVKSWIDSQDTINSDNGIVDITALQNTIGIEITDENGEAVQFENTLEGVAAYTNAVTELRAEEYREEAINSLYQRYPIIDKVLNYYIANGNSLEGFNQVPDRSQITIDENNEAQQENIIRTAWAEQNRAGDVDGYIQYLKSSNILAVTARTELEGLQALDSQKEQALAKQAEEVEKANEEAINNYWNNVNTIIESRKIGGYTMPDTIITNRNGVKGSATPKDFFNYLYQIDKNGESAYAKDLAKESKESQTEDEVLRAFLKFTGGSYSSLVGMEVNKQTVKTLKLKAKNSTGQQVKITKPKTEQTTSPVNHFGYR